MSRIGDFDISEKTIAAMHIYRMPEYICYIMRPMHLGPAYKEVQ